MNINGGQQEIDLLLGVISTVYRNHDNVSRCLAAEFRAAPQPSKQCGPSGDETSSVRFPAKMMNVLELKNSFPRVNAPSVRSIMYFHLSGICADRLDLIKQYLLLCQGQNTF